MERKYLFPKSTKAYKANLHCHSTLSDGRLTTDQIKKLYKKHGYQIVAFTDHNRYLNHAELADENFIPLAGYELNFNAHDNRDRIYKTCHINALAIDPIKAIPIEYDGCSEYNYNTINDMIRRLNHNGFIVNLNHPYWSFQDMTEILCFDGITGLELYNTATDVLYFTGTSNVYYDVWLKSGKRALALACDDTHTSCRDVHCNFQGVYTKRNMPDTKCSSLDEIPGFDGCRAFTMIYATTFTYEAIMNALQSGYTYCSNGPTIQDYYVENNKLCIDCSPVRAILVKSDLWPMSDAVIDFQDRITHAEFDLGKDGNRNAMYLRLELIRSDGHVAYTNPYYMDN